MNSEIPRFFSRQFVIFATEVLYKYGNANLKIPFFSYLAPKLKAFENSYPKELTRIYQNDADLVQTRTVRLLRFFHAVPTRTVRLLRYFHTVPDAGSPWW